MRNSAPSSRRKNPRSQDLHPSSENSTQRLNVEEIAPRVKAQMFPREVANPTPTVTTEVKSDAAERAFETVAAVLKAGAFALSARALLLLALLGAFVLARQAMDSQTFFSLAILTLYGVFAILPVAYLEARRGRTP